MFTHKIRIIIYNNVTEYVITKFNICVIINKYIISFLFSLQIVKPLFQKLVTSMCYDFCTLFVLVKIRYFNLNWPIPYS